MTEAAALIEVVKMVGGVIGALLALLLAIGAYIGGRVITKQDDHTAKLSELGLNVNRDMNAMGEKLRGEMRQMGDTLHDRITQTEGEVAFIKGRLADTNPGFMVKP